MHERSVAEAMAQDETDFDRLLKEAREWEARDRQRHEAFGMKDDGDAFPRASGARGSDAGELGKNAASDPGMKREPPRQAQAPSAQTPGSAEATWGALKAAMKEAKAQSQAQSQATRARRKGGWGWIWALILLYFIFKHFVR